MLVIDYTIRTDIVVVSSKPGEMALEIQKGLRKVLESYTSHGGESMKLVDVTLFVKVGEQ